MKLKFLLVVYLSLAVPSLWVMKAADGVRKATDGRIIVQAECGACSTPFYKNELLRVVDYTNVHNDKTFCIHHVCDQCYQVLNTFSRNPGECPFCDYCTQKNYVPNPNRDTIKYVYESLDLPASSRATVFKSLVLSKRFWGAIIVSYLAVKIYKYYTSKKKKEVSTKNATSVKNLAINKI